jgi:hypothetical protein
VIEQFLDLDQLVIIVKLYKTAFMDIDVKWRRQRKRAVPSGWIVSIMALGVVLLLILSSFGSKPVKSQSIADIDHVVLFMQVRLRACNTDRY